MTSDDPSPPAPPPLTIQARPEVAEGVYANFAKVRESSYEVAIDFANIDFSASRGALVARVSMSPMMAQQLLTVLAQTVERYANRAIEQDVADGSSDGPEAPPGGGVEG